MIEIKPLTKSDLPFLNTLRNSCRNNLHDNTEYTLEQTIEWFNTKNPQFYIVKLDRLDIAYIRTSLVDCELYIGMDLLEEYRGKGFGVKIYNQFLEDLYKRDDWPVFLEVLSFNENAYRLYKKLGFKEVGISTYSRNGEILRSIKMKLTKDDWKAIAMQTRFLIVIAYYNRPEIVKNALKSIVDLKYDNFEVAFIDDGSAIAGKPIVESIFPKELLDRTTFYLGTDTPEQKKAQGGSIFGAHINTAIRDSSAEYFILVCDDDAVLPYFFLELNAFLLKSKPPYFYSKVRFYDPSCETYLQHRENAEREFRGSWYKINHSHALNPYCMIDSSQMICNTACFKDGSVAYPFPKTRNLDADVYGKLFNKYGLCVPCGLYGQIKAAFAGQLGNIHTDY
jgi:GNAT superfamily N-acetyltransferase